MRMIQGNHGFTSRKSVGFQEALVRRFQSQPGSNGILSFTFMAGPFSLSVPVSSFCPKTFICYPMQTEGSPQQLSMSQTTVTFSWRNECSLTPSSKLLGIRWESNLVQILTDQLSSQMQLGNQELILRGPSGIGEGES